MPRDMPREDYASPALYAFGYLGRIARYIVYSIVGFGLASLVGVEAAHQYVEAMTALAAPSHLVEEYDLMVENESEPGQDAIVSPDDPDYWSWAEENDGWTGGANGGTSSALGFVARHSLRSAWVASAWGAGNTLSATASIGKDSHLGSGANATYTAAGGAKGMIGANNSNKASIVNNVDQGFQLAEAYIAQAIDKAGQLGSNHVVLPDTLSVQRDPTPSEVPVQKGQSTREEVRARRVGNDLVLRHAESLERLGTPSALVRSLDSYERVLRALASRTPTTTTPVASTTATTRGRLARDAREAELIRLSRKVAELSHRVGDEERASAWWTWALKRAGVEQAMTSTMTRERPVERVTVTKSGWLGRKSVEESPSSTSPTAQANATPQLSPPPFSPVKSRATVSLLDAYSTRAALSGDLATAATYQSRALDLIRSDSSSSAAAAASTSQPQRLHRTWMNARSALLTMHGAEIAYARHGDASSALQLLTDATTKAEKVIADLSSTSSRAEDGCLRVQSSALASSFGEDRPKDPLRSPARLLLRDARRTYAEGWNLVALLQERQAGRAADSSRVTSQEFYELALDAVEKAIGWNRIADGQEVRGQHDVHADEEPTGPITSGTKREEYWRNYARLKTRLELGLSA